MTETITTKSDYIIVDNDEYKTVLKRSIVFISPDILDELPHDAIGTPLKTMQVDCGIFCEEK